MNIVKKITASMLALATCMSLAAVGAITANADDNTTDKSGIQLVELNDTGNTANVDYSYLRNYSDDIGKWNGSITIKNVKAMHQYKIIQLTNDFFYNPLSSNGKVPVYLEPADPATGNPYFTQFGTFVQCMGDNRPPQYTGDFNDDLPKKIVSLVPDKLWENTPDEYKSLVPAVNEPECLGWPIGDGDEPKGLSFTGRLFDYMMTWTPEQQRTFINNLGDSLKGLTQQNQDTQNETYLKPLIIRPSKDYDSVRVNITRSISSDASSDGTGVYLIIDSKGSPMLAITGSKLKTPATTDGAVDMSTVETKPGDVKAAIDFCFKSKDFSNDKELAGAEYKVWNNNTIFDNADKLMMFSGKTKEEKYDNYADNLTNYMFPQALAGVAPDMTVVSDDKGTVCLNGITYNPPKEYTYTQDNGVQIKGSTIGLYTIYETKAPAGYLGLSSSNMIYGSQSSQRFTLEITNPYYDFDGNLQYKYFLNRSHSVDYAGIKGATSGYNTTETINWPTESNKKDVPGNKYMMYNTKGEAWNKDKVVAYYIRESTNDGDMPHTGSYTMWAIVGIATILMGGALFLLRRAQKVKD